MKLRALLILTGAVCSLVACSSKKADDCSTGKVPDPICAALDYTTLDPAAVSFQTDLFPRIQSACNSPLCHSNTHIVPETDLPAGGLYLGPRYNAIVEPDLTDVLTDLMAVSKNAPSMHRVVASEPANSFLMLKLTGCQGSVTGCMRLQSEFAPVYQQGCGDSMPPACDQTDWTPADSSLFARWIAQGANKN